MSNTPDPARTPPVAAIETLAEGQLARMLAAGREALECRRVLRKGGLNIVGELLKGQGTFYEFNHYPDGDVFDPDTHGQYYYHAHRGDAGEHGHFHTFLRAGGMPAGITPVTYEGEEQWPTGADAHSHLVAISMDAHGWPTGLFATNRWVTGECWYAATDVTAMLDHFAIDHAYPSWPVNRWLGAMFVLFRPEIEALVEQRDQVVAAWAVAHPGVDVFEDRGLELTGMLEISVERRVADLEALLD